jgi:uncharacterized protein DUF6308
VTVVLRSGVRIDNPLEVALGFLDAYGSREVADASSSSSFDESDLRRANRGGARISAAEIAAILERRPEIEQSLDALDSSASLAASSDVVPWGALTRLFESFGGLPGVGYSKMTKALYVKRPGLIPILDSVVQDYLKTEKPTGSFGEEATALVRRFKRDLDDNIAVLRDVQRQLAAHTYRVTEVRLLDVLIWSALAGA